MKRSLSPHRSRSLSPWQGFPLAGLREEMEDLFSRFLGEGELSLRDAPQLDVSETEKAIEVKADIPGYKAENIDVQLDGNRLTITGTVSEEQTKEDEDRKFHVVERRSGSFTRSITLPVEVDEANVDARYNDGVLTVVLPKSAETAAKKIQIKS